MHMDFKEQVFWIKNRMRGGAYRAYLDAVNYDSLSCDEKSFREFEKQKMIVSYAYNHVKHYRELYDKCGFHPSQLKNPLDWEQVPVLEKDILRYKPETVLSDDYKVSELSISTTSGSTGLPLKVFKDPRVYMEVMGWRALQWWDVSPAANMGKLHRKAAGSLKEKIKNRLLWWPTKRAYLNASQIITDAICEQFVNDINHLRIEWIQGYCSLIETVADYIIKTGHESRPLKTVWCTSAPLKLPVRKKMERAFHCQIMDQYGCNEMWNIALQKRGEPYLTVCSDYVHIDTVNADNRQTAINEDGEILITDLNCKAFPLIRYRLGDRGSFAMSADVSSDGYPKLNFVNGRTSDNIVLKNGDLIDGVYLTAICDDYPDIIDAYQVCQANDYSITLKLVLKNSNSFSKKNIEEILLKLNAVIGGETICKVETLSHIPDIKGKKRYIISEVKR